MSAGGYRVVPLYFIICPNLPTTGFNLIVFLPHLHGSDTLSQISPVLNLKSGIPVIPNDNQHIHVEEIRNVDNQAINDIGGRRNREDDQPEERQVKPRLEPSTFEQHVDQFVEFNDDWISESDSEFKSDPEYGEDGFSGWLKIMDYYDPNGEEYDSEYGY